jgi:hypothetical protein
LVTGLNPGALPQTPVQAVPVIPHQQPDIASLISTAAGGNPALAQLLAQMANSQQQQQQQTPGYSPSMPNNQIDHNEKN